MKLTRNILRGVFLIIIVSIIIGLIRTVDDHATTIARFKLETYGKIKSDSLNTRQRLDTLAQATRAWSTQMGEDSAAVRMSVYQLIGVVVLLIVSELYFSKRAREKAGEK